MPDAFSEVFTKRCCGLLLHCQLRKQIVNCHATLDGQLVGKDTDLRLVSTDILTYTLAYLVTRPHRLRDV